jgi:hypothetical protein
METFVQAVACNALGYQLTPQDGFRKVRVSWPQGGQPDWKIDENVAFLRITWADDVYDRLRETKDFLNDDQLTITRATYYTRVWHVEYVIYGPDCIDFARRLVSALFLDDIHDQFAENNLYLVTDIPTPRRVPELFNSEWWNRVDFAADFNEAVIETRVINRVTSAEVKVYNEDAASIDQPTEDIEVAIEQGE